MTLYTFKKTGYDDEKIARLTREAVHAGFNHFKMKVGADIQNDLRRGRLIRSIIDDPAEQRGAGPDPASIVRKNAGPTGAVLMVDANQVCLLISGGLFSFGGFCGKRKLMGCICVYSRSGTYLRRLIMLKV